MKRVVTWPLAAGCESRIWGLDRLYLEVALSALRKPLWVVLTG